LSQNATLFYQKVISRLIIVASVITRRNT